MRVLATFATLLVLSLSVLVSADISEFFLRDPYDQLDLFRRSKPASQSEKAKEASADPEDDDELVEDYLDYLMDVGALPSTDKEETEEKEKKQEEETKKLRPRKGPYEVGDDVLAAVKQPFTPNRRMSNYKKKQSSRRIASGNHIQDNIALESSMPVVRRRKPQYSQQPQPPMRRRSDEIKKPVMSQKLGKGQADLPGLENVERLIPSSLKTVIEDSGKRIVKAVMKPINAASRPRNTHIKETSFSSKMESWLQPYRTYFGYMAPTFAPAHITTFLVTQWVSTIAITFAWITVGYMYNTMIAGRSSEGRSSQEPWEYLVPDSDTVSTVLRDLSDAAQRWHDEL